MRDAYIVTSVRTPGCKRSKGAFKDTRPEDLLSFILSAAVDKTDNLAKEHVEDIMIGCSFPGGGAGAERRARCRSDGRLSGCNHRRHRESILFLRIGSHRPGFAQGYGRLVGCRYRRWSGVHVLRAHGRQPAPAASGVYAPGSPGVHFHGHHGRKCGPPLQYYPGGPG